MLHIFKQFYEYNFLASFFNRELHVCAPYKLIKLNKVYYIVLQRQLALTSVLPSGSPP